MRIALLAASLMFSPACGDGRGPPAPPPGFAHAAATRDCGPADGPAVSIYLASQPVDRLDPPAPFIHLYLWRGLDDLAGERWSVAGDRSEGSARYCAADGRCELATSGSVQVEAVDADSTVRASTSLLFPTFGEVSGGIVARWIPRTIEFCI